jgi:hypothetical protein
MPKNFAARAALLFAALLATAVFCQQERAAEFTDPRNGKKYRTVKIGEQTWMAENLNYNASDSKCYDNKLANCEKYGRLYDWNTAKVAPQRLALAEQRGMGQTVPLFGWHKRHENPLQK